MVVSASQDSQIKLYNLRTCTVERSVPMKTMSISSIICPPKSNSMLLGKGDYLLDFVFIYLIFMEMNRNFKDSLFFSERGLKYFLLTRRFIFTIFICHLKYL